jgi:hypothetical protein
LIFVVGPDDPDMKEYGFLILCFFIYGYYHQVRLIVDPEYNKKVKKQENSRLGLLLKGINHYRIVGLLILSPFLLISSVFLSYFIIREEGNFISIIVILFNIAFMTTYYFYCKIVYKNHKNRINKVSH